MAYQSIFRRFELKYILTQEQKDAVLAAIAQHMMPDKYGKTTIRNIYFDTDNYRLIRQSIEKPIYKEKLRIRSYGPAAPEDDVYVELKKKFKGVVYKRRLKLPQKDAIDWLCNAATCRSDTQIAREIDYFLAFYQTLHPRIFLSYQRQAYVTKDGSDFRVTFDDSILCRQENICLDAPICGAAVLPEGLTLMEIKSPGGIPLWLTKALSENRIFKTSFSKYGKAYETIIYPKLTQEAKTNA